ncbi:MAG: peptidylprolyl isomerase [Candidatus Nanohalobium sp.]
MEKSEMVLVRYTGKQDGNVFDTTEEEKAKEVGLYQEGRSYSPIPVLVGESYVIEGLEEALEEMDVGDEKEIEVPSEKAYGSRDSDKIETYPEKEFKKQDVQVRVGEELMIGNRRGKVISKGSGRVRIDFNHPLSGKDLEYWIKVEEKVEDDEDLAENIFEYRLGHGDMEIEDGTVKIYRIHSHGDHRHELPQEAIDEVSKEIKEYTDLEVEVIDDEKEE